jgi:hypothetical protein
MSWFNSSSKVRVAVLFCLIILVVGGGIIAYSMFFAHRATFLKSSYSGTLTMGCPKGCFSEPMDLLISTQSQGGSISGEVHFHPSYGGMNTCSFTGMVLAKKQLAFQCYFNDIAEVPKRRGHAA